MEAKLNPQSNDSYKIALCQWQNDSLSTEKSRSDGTILTVDFNLRNGQYNLSTKSRRDDTIPSKYRPCGTWCVSVAFLARRINSTVNKMLSLRDISPLTQHHTSWLFFIPICNNIFIN